MPILTLIIITVENNMVDLHTHILPSIDDGASSFEEALGMLRMMTENGITTVVATPHFDFEKNQKKEFVEQRNGLLLKLQSLVRENKISIEILSGCEIMFTPNLDNYILDDLTIEGTDYLLIELSTRKNEPMLEATLSSIIASGYIPILAHIERYPYLINNSKRLANLVEQGVLMQVNSYNSKFKRENAIIKKLEKRNLVHIIASDAHNTTDRAPNLIFEEMQSGYIDNQIRIVKNEQIPVKKPKRNIFF